MMTARRQRASWRDQRLFLICWFALVCARLALAWLGYRRLAPLVPASSKAPPPQLALRIEAAMLRASRYVPRSTCLAQACAVRALLALKGYGATMRVGVRSAPDGGLTAHAWLLSGEKVILGSRVPDFSAYRILADFS